MTELRITTLTMPAAELGPENPLPMFRAKEANMQVNCDEHNLPISERAGFGVQTGFRVLPYRMQDGYTRDCKPRDFTAIILENEYLKVTVLPETGGRVHSIVYKPEDRELLSLNTEFQPANFALRNAWWAGGIEWNTAQLGHHYLTCSPFHAARVISTDGYPVLRLYAWDRGEVFPISD